MTKRRDKENNNVMSMGADNHVIIIEQKNKRYVIFHLQLKPKGPHDTHSKE